MGYSRDGIFAKMTFRGSLLTGWGVGRGLFECISCVRILLHTDVLILSLPDPSTKA